MVEKQSQKIRAGVSPPPFRSMPERKHFFLREGFPYPGTQKDTNTNSTVGTKCLWVGDSDNALSLTEQTTLLCLQTVYCMNCLAFYGTHVYIQMVTAWPKIKVLNIIWGYRRL